MGMFNFRSSVERLTVIEMSLSVVPNFTFEDVERFFKMKNTCLISKDMVKGYKYFVEEYIHDIIAYQTKCRITHDKQLRFL